MIASLFLLAADPPESLATTISVATGIVLSVVVAAISFLPIFGVSRRLSAWRRELEPGANGASPIQEGYQRDWFASLPSDGSPVPAAEVGRLENSMRTQFNPRWAGAIAVGLLPFLIGLGTVAYLRTATGSLGFASATPWIIGSLLTLLNGLAVWGQHANAQALFDRATAQLKARLHDDLARSGQATRDQLERLRLDGAAKVATIAGLEKEITRLRDLISGARRKPLRTTRRQTTRSPSFRPAHLSIYREAIGYDVEAPLVLVHQRRGHDPRCGGVAGLANELHRNPGDEPVDSERTL